VAVEQEDRKKHRASAQRKKEKKIASETDQKGGKVQVEPNQEREGGCI